MSGYQYKTTAAERKAAELLRAKGWSVSEPVCPLCRGFGTMWGGQTWTLGEDEPSISTTLSVTPCPNACVVAWYYTVGTDTSPHWTLITEAGS